MKRFLLFAAGAAVGLIGCGGPPQPVEPEPASPPDVARVVCREGSAIVETPTARPQRDGVHFRVENQTDETLYFLAQPGLHESNVDPGVTTVVGQVPPGTSRVGCYDPNKVKPDEGELSWFAVDDPDDLWVSPELECIGQFHLSIFRDFTLKGAERGDPVAIVRGSLRGVRPEDTLERATYPQSSDLVVRVVRDARVVLAADLRGDEEIGWVVESVQGCAEEDIRLE